VECWVHPPAQFFQLLPARRWAFMMVVQTAIAWNADGVLLPTFTADLPIGWEYAGPFSSARSIDHDWLRVGSDMQ